MNLSDLPNLAIHNLLLQIDLPALIQICATNTKIRNICNNDFFWREKFYRDFSDIDIFNQLEFIFGYQMGNYNLPMYLNDANMTWQELYQHTYWNKTSITIHINNTKQVISYVGPDNFYDLSRYLYKYAKTKDPKVTEVLLIYTNDKYYYTPPIGAYVNSNDLIVFDTDNPGVVKEIGVLNDVYIITEVDYGLVNFLKVFEMRKNRISPYDLNEYGRKFGRMLIDERKIAFGI